MTTTLIILLITWFNAIVTTSEVIISWDLFNHKATKIAIGSLITIVDIAVIVCTIVLLVTGGLK